MKTYKPYALVGFEPGILCSGGVGDDHYATPPGLHLQFDIFFQFYLLKNTF
jgi:hypothetical protein